MEEQKITIELNEYQVNHLAQLIGDVSLPVGSACAAVGRKVLEMLAEKSKVFHKLEK